MGLRQGSIEVLLAMALDMKCDMLVKFNIWQLLILRTEDVCFSANVPEGSLRVVHETWYNHSKWGQWM